MMNKKRLILPLACAAFFAAVSAVFAGEAVIMEDTFDNLEAWQRSASGVTAEAGTLKISAQDSGEEVKIYKYSGTNADAYLRTLIGESFKYETEIKISDFFEGGIENGYSAGITVNNSAY